MKWNSDTTLRIDMKLKDLFDKLLFFPMSMFLSMKEIYDLDAEYFETNAVIRELHEINEYARKRR